MRLAAALVLAVIPSVTLAMTQTKELPAPQAGLWHLLLQGQDEKNLPDNRTDLRLYPTPAPFRAAIVNYATGDEFPYPVAVFDGRTLTLQMGAHGGGSLPGTPLLRLAWDGTKFEGTYVDPAFQPLAKSPRLKLVRSAK